MQNPVEPFTDELDEINLKQYSNFICSYFYSVDAGFWSLRHYIDWICKNEKELPQWETCLDNFYNSLDFVNSRRGVSIYIRTCARRNLDNKEVSVEDEIFVTIILLTRFYKLAFRD